MKPPYHLWLGWDATQLRAYEVAELSATLSAGVVVHRLALHQLVARGLYHRPTTERDHGFFDQISQAPMATSHAISRFLVPYLSGYDGWALFTDGDVLFRANLAELFALADPAFAVMVVPHAYAPEAVTKMEGQRQTRYPRKNWSSVMLFNCAHPANRALDLALVNTVPGRDLHRFCWLTDDLIGVLPDRWNWLVGHSSPAIDPAIVHFTTGVPDMPGYEHVAYADEWYVMAAACGYRLERPEAVA